MRRQVLRGVRRLATKCASPAFSPIKGGPYHFGREVSGVDLAAPELPAEELLAALYEHGLLLFRGQQHLTPDDEMRFASLFTHQADDANQSYTGGAGTQHRLPAHPSIALVGSYNVRDFHGLTASSPGVYNGWHPDQRAWHCDGLADTDPPPDLTTMRCLVTPEASRPVRVQYRLFAQYEVAREGTSLRWASGSKGDTDESWDVNLAEGGATTSPVSGKRALVGSYHVAALRSRGRTLGFDEANAYVAAAWAPGLEEGLLLKHRWRVGDLVAWSNRLVIHTATSTAPYRGKERLHTRIRMRSTPEHAPQAWVE
ncbi:hypothetical protein EMIHUDRAFT_196463 [Emiliania huxleyi CCMP1516]|uniref:TauD/TfdA-like domain-containing protein n=2 Tax=Emiliania huxleyi TaxID=2903 RepID=A0A0D3J457_EMIH1|nr:hypothetical protein EMIHUDRAFT_196463 [Emiliania huxleyi CCMP1516]EOD18292.1 hypothetical protein EMIHUDRAFT_196463 [Emiliania huxleyi CCMP1516]|eukprot:XP_005770721.1 hypothetical protein EMIHUDRAFT_196463 [Emiliania huxleyi CCMP1516]